MRIGGMLRAAMLACAMVACAGFKAPPGVSYTIAPLMQDGALHALAVQVDFRGDADGETVLKLPDSWGGKDELWRGVEALEIVHGAQMLEGESVARRVLRHDRGARIRIRYRIVQDWEGEPTAGDGNPYRPMVQPGYFHIIGHTALITPDIADDTPVRLSMRNLPRGWRFASDLEHDGLTLDHVGESVSVGGDYRIIETRDPNVRLAIRGAWSFADDTFASEVESILAAQRSFWGDSSRPYLVTVTQMAAPPGASSLGGTNLSDAFAFFATPNVEGAQITRILAHEGLHTWVPGAIGGMDEDEVAQRGHYWLSEGFTDFFTSRLLVRTGVWTPAQFADDLNETLRAYARSPERTAPNARIVEAFWENNDVQRLPYQRGRLLALMWDARLRASGGGKDFDDVVFAMRERAQSGDAHAIALLPLAAAAQGLSLGDDLTIYVERGEMVQLPESALAPCGRIVTREASSYDPGFDWNATQAGDWVIAGVSESGPAYAAGLRNGMHLRQASFRQNEPDEERVIMVSDTPDGAPRPIRYYPRGRDPIRVQQLELAAPLEGETLARCLAVLGGG